MEATTLGSTEISIASVLIFIATIAGLLLKQWKDIPVAEDRLVQKDIKQETKKKEMDDTQCNLRLPNELKAEISDFPPIRSDQK